MFLCLNSRFSDFGGTCFWPVISTTHCCFLSHLYSKYSLLETLPSHFVSFLSLSGQSLGQLHNVSPSSLSHFPLPQTPGFGAYIHSLSSHLAVKAFLSLPGYLQSDAFLQVSFFIRTIFRRNIMQLS